MVSKNFKGIDKTYWYRLALDIVEWGTDKKVMTIWDFGKGNLVESRREARKHFMKMGGEDFEMEESNTMRFLELKIMSMEDGEENEYLVTSNHETEGYGQVLEESLLYVLGYHVHIKDGKRTFKKIAS